MTSTEDIIDLALGPAASAAMQPLRDARPVVRRESQLSIEALLGPAHGLSALERHAVAVRVATRHGSGALAALYQQRLDALHPGVPPARLEAMLEHADLLSTDPAAARPAHLEALAAAGLGAAEIVTLSQLIGLLAYQARVVAGLGLLHGASA